MSRYRRRTALVGVGALTAGLLLTSPQSAEAANLIKNPGFETAGTGDMPYCWEKAGWGDNDFTYETTSDAHSGAKAMKVTLTRRVDGDRKAMFLESTDCAPAVGVGKQYDLGLWYKTTTPDANVTLFRHDSTTGWQYWTDVKTLQMASDWTRATVRTPEIPAGTDRITWGVSVYGTGSATTDDYTMEQVPDPLPPAQCTGTSDQCANGSWSVLPTQNPVRSMHSVVLNNGKVLLIAGSGNSEDAFNAGTFTSAVYDPANGTYKVIPTPKDLFCAGHVQLQDGRVLVLSGNKAYSVAGGHGYEGFKDSYVFDPGTETYTKTNDLNDGHWYPSATELGNGDVITFGGLREDSTGSVTADRWSDKDQQWLPSWKVHQTWSFWGLYPAMVLMQDGRLFYTGSHVFGNNIPGTGSAIYDYDANTITQIPGLQNKDQRDQSASVLLPPAQDQRVLTIGGGNIESNPDANRLTDVIDLKQASPSYVAGPPLPQGTVDLGAGKVAESGNQGKMYVSTVLLPDGKVMETGGALHNRANAVYESSLYDPGTNTFDPVAADPESRGYHSTAFLLPDGRVMATGDNPGNGSWNHNVSVYTPPYLYKGTRPTITSVINQEWKYGDTQRITVDHPVAKAELIRPAAVTHSSDPNQRFVDLPLSVDGNNVDLNVTNNPNIAPPGWYMLFAVDANGVPSVARWVHLTGPAALGPTTAAPHVHAFADALTGKESGPGQKRASQAVSPTISGCDRHYGSVNVCVPTVFPPRVKKTAAARCTWLKQNHYGRLKVNGGDDPLGLDRNRDGVACGKGDVTRR
ncbi:galactose oxidase-like domain-containing protein [Streptomyces sp. NPDC001135]